MNKDIIEKVEKDLEEGVKDFEYYLKNPKRNIKIDNYSSERWIIYFLFFLVLNIYLLFKASGIENNYGEGFIYYIPRCGFINVLFFIITYIDHLYFTNRKDY